MKKGEKVFLTILIMGFLLSSMYLIYKLPQVYGKIALGVSFLVLTVSFIKIKWLRNILLIVCSGGVIFILYSGFAFLDYTENKKTVFDSIEYAVTFEKGTFKEALQKSKELNKPIFIDFYTVWCAPCLAFSKNVLTDEEVAKYMNKAFLNLKYDAEKGEGISISEKYNISSYPTLLIINHKGEIVEHINKKWVPNSENMIDISKRYLSTNISSQ
ncbi:thioredoxin family protein [Sphingobacterium thermophilum]|uniref:Thioredoxin domain-containing protein n=1 Tax=Sphingobacterium thermophilum TaxID=768534 RepID=A0ABP8R1U7_9SPHI